MPNQLIGEKSPYLLQHAYNPVDWRPWGEAAFAQARQENKPIFLSVGYSTCHWCHVMERESFENPAIAEVLNRNFVPVKVDREERPDVDRIYMLFVQATTGSGGWPMSVWLTPDLKPFYGGTYFPPESRQGHPGFRYVLERIAETWALERSRILDSSNQVLEQLRQVGAAERTGVLDESVFESAYNSFRRSFDVRLGGFGGAPKFPRPSVHNFLLRYFHRGGNREALDMVSQTLAAMARGGINDHLGGGFHRYSVDERWFLPHFEKMLYDQAQLAVSYLEAFQLTGEAAHAAEARRILDYVLRDMTHPEGGFFSAEDADSPLVAGGKQTAEGAFYVWTQSEIETRLGRPDAEWFCHRFGVESAGNVGYDPHGEFGGKNILYQAHSPEETARHFGVAVEEVESSLDASREKLLAARSRRPRPHLDDKVLTAWNGLMLSALAKAAQVLDDGRYLDAARRAADFLVGRMFSRGVLYRRFRDGDAAVPGFLDDYAFLAQGLLDLYEAGFEPADLSTALELGETLVREFEDPVEGGFFSTSGNASDLVLRVKDDYDGAEPSGNSIAILTLLRLAQYTGRAALREAAGRALQSFAGRLASMGAALPQMLVACLYSLGKPRQIVIVGERGAAETRALLERLRRRFLPDAIVLLLEEGSRQRLGELLPEIRDMHKRNGVATAYVCRNYACELPTTDPEEFARSL